MAHAAAQTRMRQSRNSSGAVRNDPATKSTSGTTVTSSRTRRLRRRSARGVVSLTLPAAGPPEHVQGVAIDPGHR